MRFDLPTPDLETKRFWDATKEERDDVEWVEASGRATLYTWSVVHRNDLPPFHERIPYVAAIAELEEGPRMMTNVVDCDFDALEIGMALEAVFHPTSEDVTIVQFRPASANS
jgi:uncharacterized OB-fold protein